MKKRKIKLLPDFIAHDFLRKFIALIFAILIWGRVSSKLDDEEKIRGIHVEIRMPQEFVLMEDTPFDIDVTLRGSKQKLNKITSEDLKVSVYIGDPVQGPNKIFVSKADISLPKGVTIVGIGYPKNRDVLIDRKMSKRVPVKLTLIGSLMEGYAFNIRELIPKKVTISGPRSIIENEFEARADLLLGRDNVEDFDTPLKIQRKRYVTIMPNSVMARIEIFKKDRSREYQDVPIKPFGYYPSGEQIEIVPIKATVVVNGQRSTVETLTLDDIVVYCDMSKITKPGEYTLNTQCWIKKKGVNLLSIKPATVNVRVSNTK